MLNWHCFHSLDGLVKSVHGVNKLMVQHVGVLVGLQLVRDEPLLKALVVLGDTHLVLGKDLHAKLVFHFAVIGLVVFQLHGNGTWKLSDAFLFVYLYI